MCCLFFLVTYRAYAAPALENNASGSEIVSEQTREIRVTNGEMINPQQYPFLTAVLSGRKALVQIDSVDANGVFFAGAEPLPFSGQISECGLALEPCVGTTSMVCSIVVDFSPANMPTISPAQQLENCRLGGGVGAIFRTGTAGGSFDLQGIRPSIPAVYLSDFESTQKLLNALMQSLDVNVNITPSVPDVILCGGTYLGGQWVLTAAHCVTDDFGGSLRTIEPSELLVNVAAHSLAGEKEFAQRVVEIVTNNYHTNGAWGVNDYALLRLAELPQRGESVPLISSDELTSLAAAAAPALVLGWGSTEVRDPLEPIGFASTRVSNFPLIATLALHTVESCRTLWHEFFGLNSLDAIGLSINQSHVCASNVEFQRDTCQGDSGGPLLVSSEGKLKLAGITNFGLGCGSTNSVPGVYASVPSFSQWIENVTGLTPTDNRDRLGTPVSTVNQAPTIQFGGSGMFQPSAVATIFALAVFRRRRRR